MKKTLLLIALLALSGPAFSQTYQLMVENGYGSTTASAGDTLYIWSREWGWNRTFSHWSGDTAALELPDEWRTRVIMPAHDVAVKANTQPLSTGSNDYWTFEEMQGKLLKKPVYSYFPAGGSPRLVVWLWHGSGGTAANWTGKDFQMRQFANYLVANDIAIIVTEGDEATLNADLDTSGYVNYEFSPDTNSRDIANVRAIRDTFIHRGKMTWATPQAALGFSAGGAFSVMLANALGWPAAIAHCSSGGIPARTSATYSMSQRDGHPEVGMAGNLEAYKKVDTLKSLGRCAEFVFHRPNPIYPERFLRIPSLSAATATALYHELVANGCVGADGFLTRSPNEIEAMILNNPSNWPMVLAQGSFIQGYLKDELGAMWAIHGYKHDYMAADLKFLLHQCSVPSPTQMPENVAFVRVFPNPVAAEIFLSENMARARVFDFSGRLVLEKTLGGAAALDVSALPSGAYFLEIFTENGARQAGRFVKI